MLYEFMEKARTTKLVDLNLPKQVNLIFFSKQWSKCLIYVYFIMF